jgi:threonine synthase
MPALRDSQWRFHCGGCGSPFPQDGFPFRCPLCGSLFEFSQNPIYDPHAIEKEGTGIKRFQGCLPLLPDTEWITLGEGNTPLVELEHNGRQIYLKCEHLNPTGSFKDRGSAILVSAMKHAGIEKAVEDSSGNAGASFAAYAAHAGIHARIFIPEYASGPKRQQIEAYGAEVIPIPGPRFAATQAVMEEVDRGATYASHAHHPHGIAGMMTIAYELVEQLAGAPGTIIAPVGQGSLLLGLVRGFQALLDASVITNLPRLIAVQSEACAPIWAEFKGLNSDLSYSSEGDTIAEGIRILNPLRAEGVIVSISDTQGDVVAVGEDKIIAGWRELAQNGFYVEPTSAVVWPALMELWDHLHEPVVLILTGNGLKSTGIHND